jgi:hypothetical protein
MKLIKTWQLAVLILTLTFSVASCGDDDDDAPDNTDIINDIEDNVQSGTWRITKFIDSGEDETTDFAGYNFSFKDNGVLTATKAASVINGSWNISQSSDDDSSNDLDMNIVFTSPDNFEDLTEDWDFISETASKIELIHISGGNGGTDYLTFEKN